MGKLRKIGGSTRRWFTRTVEERIAKIDELIHRPIKWEIIRSLAPKGELRRCEICGEEESGGFWCNPCIHKTWCCICCILLGVPNYEVGMFILHLDREGGE